LTTADVNLLDGQRDGVNYGCRRQAVLISRFGLGRYFRPLKTPFMYE
jgi:hypothetical protein